MNKEESLLLLKKEIEENQNLPLYGEGNLVFGEGSADAEVLFIGEAPGFHEDKLSRPFVGQAGKLLDKLLLMIKWPRESVYITNIVKRRPPSNRDPLPSEIDAYKPYLERQIKIIDPKIIATLGRYSMNYFLPEAKISRDHGVAQFAGEYLILPLYHPAAALRATGTEPSSMSTERAICGAFSLFEKLSMRLCAYSVLKVMTRANSPL